MKLIGICGAKGSGKSEVAKYLVSHYGYTKMRFAEPLKQMLATLLRYQGVSEDIIERMLDGDLKEVPAAELEGRGLKGQDKVVIDDLRFLHEEKRIRELGGRVILVKKEIAEKSKSGLMPEQHHISEVEFNLIRWNTLIHNNGTLDDLHSSIDNLF